MSIQEEGGIVQRCQLIYNPVSGKKDFVNHLDYVESRLNEGFRSLSYSHLSGSVSESESFELGLNACEISNASTKPSASVSLLRGEVWLK